MARSFLEMANRCPSAGGSVEQPKLLNQILQDWESPAPKSARGKWTKQKEKGLGNYLTSTDVVEGVDGIAPTDSEPTAVPATARHATARMTGTGI